MITTYKVLVFYSFVNMGWFYLKGGVIPVFEKNLYENEDFSNCVITVEFLDKKKFSNCKFNSVDFTDVDTISSCVFDSCDFASADFNGIEIVNCAFLLCEFKFTNFFMTKLEECKMTGSSLLLAKSLTEITGGDWSYTDMRSLKFSRHEFSRTIFTGADLSGCQFERCKFRECDFDDAIVHDTNFSGSDIRMSSFNNVNFEEADFRNSKVDLQLCVAMAETMAGVRYEST